MRPQEEGNLLVYRGCNYLKQRLVLSILSGKPVRIENIRRKDGGLKEFEVSLIRLMDKITNGTSIEVNETGENLLFSPGLLNGGFIEHDCSLQRSIGYYLDALLSLGPFCKNPLQVKLNGITDGRDSPSIDYIRASGLCLLKKFLVVDEGLELKIVKRGVMPLGGGEVLFRCPVRKDLRAQQWLNQGMVKRVRGTVFACKMPAAVVNRTVEATKEVLLNFLPDIYIYTDQNKGKLSGKSPGFGIHLSAETNEGVVYSAQAISNVLDERNKDPSVPEDLGKEAAQRLLEEIYRGGCVDSSHQWLCALFMALAQKDVSKFVVGPLSQYTIAFLQHLKAFFGVTFKLESKNSTDEDAEEDLTAPKVVMTCVGIGYKNVGKRAL